MLNTSEYLLSDYTGNYQGRDMIDEYVNSPNGGTIEQLEQIETYYENNTYNNKKELDIHGLNNAVNKINEQSVNGALELIANSDMRKPVILLNDKTQKIIWSEENPYTVNLSDAYEYYDASIIEDREWDSEMR